MVRRSVVAVAVLVGLVLTAGCSFGDDGPSPMGDPGPTVSGEPRSVEEVAPAGVSVAVSLSGEQVEVVVGPVVVHDGYGVLGISAVGQVERRADLGLVLNDPYIGSPGPDAVRLVDPRAGTVSSVALDGDGRPVMTDGLADVGVEPVQVSAVFAVPVGEVVDVLLPEIGYVAGVPVVRAEDVEGEVTELTELTDAAPGELQLPVYVLDTYVEQLGGDVRTRSEDDAVTVAVSADVLFATDSAELGAAADEALIVAGGQIADFAGGALVIVGHTDDVASHAYNDELSVRRAQAVADRLAELVDLSAYDVSVEGRGKREPVASGTSDEARAANRRVELRFTPTEEAPGESEQGEVRSGPIPFGEGEMPETDGPVATGAQGVQISFDDRDYRVGLDQVRRIDGVLVGELEVTQVAGGGGFVGGLFAGGAWDARGDTHLRMQSAATNVTILAGSTRVSSFDYVTSEAHGWRNPLADRYLGAVPVEVDQTTRVTVVWPDVAGDTVVVDAPQRVHSIGFEFGGPPFRLTDVPVVDG